MLAQFQVLGVTVLFLQGTTSALSKKASTRERPTARGPAETAGGPRITLTKKPKEEAAEATCFSTRRHSAPHELGSGPVERHGRRTTSFRYASFGFFGGVPKGEV